MGLAAPQQRNVTNFSQQISATNCNTIAKMGFLVVLQHDAFSSAVGSTLMGHSCFNTYLMTDGLPKRQALQAKKPSFRKSLAI